MCERDTCERERGAGEDREEERERERDREREEIPVVPPGVGRGNLMAFSSNLIEDAVVRVHWMADVFAILLLT